MSRTSLLALFAVLIAPDSGRAQAFDARTALRSIGDLDGDGVRDLLVSNRDVKERECVWAVSCKTGQLMYRIDSGMTGDGFGRAMAEVGDIDKDGVSDFVVGAIGARPSTMFPGDYEPFEMSDLRTPHQRWEFVTSGYVSAFSGKTGKLLFQARSKTSEGAFAFALVGAGDTNGDGVPDFVVGNPFKCECAVHSGQDGALLMTLPSPNGAHPHDDFGASLANLGDVDGDGREDWAVGAPLAELPAEDKRPRSLTPAGAVFIVSGKDSRVIRALRGEPDEHWFGGTIARARSTDPVVGVLAVAAVNHRLRVWSITDWSVRHESREDVTHSGMNWFVTSLDFVRDTNTNAATRLILSDAEMSDSGPSMGYVELQPLGGAIAPKVRLRGADVCALDDLDGDHITDVALLDVQAMRLTFSSGRDDSKLREITLVQRAPTQVATPPNQPTPR